ncbi:DUF4031 domain-containing protein [Nesterenkonia sp. Act20]|uniref:DUF4031 domain-containing protein n=1 Tax=Nesterenkonia sp. Act20 TaxID=1483432 RepID=UPI001C465C7D|nr:DUF4031 domain-containing protein [Nesterenkonia sp. Act20]
MTIYIDPPSWPAHGTVFSHLISDTSLQELHDLAATAGISIRAFDQDHYDVPAHRYEDLVSRGAVPVSGRELTRVLLRCGLRIPAAHRPEKLRPNLSRAWSRLGHTLQAAEALTDDDAARSPAADFNRLWGLLGEELLDRWSEPHRSYHAMTHLAAVLRGVGTLDRAGELPHAQRPVVSLAAWFHDAVYSGAAGADEEESALLAETRLGPLLGAAAVSEAARLVRVTETHDPLPDDRNGAVLVDADLQILAQDPARYAQYTAAVRQDYRHVAETDFRHGRAQVLQRLLERPTLFHTAMGRARWESQARANLHAELELLTRG